MTLAWLNGPPGCKGSPITKEKLAKLTNHKRGYYVTLRRAERGVFGGRWAPPYNSSVTATHSWKSTIMSPEVKKEPVASKLPSDNDTDEGFHSPSTSRSELRCSKEGATNTAAEPQNSANNIQEKPDNDVMKARRLAEFTVLTVTGRSKTPPQDSVEETLIRCVRSMMQKHEILLRGMMRRLNVRPETGYQSFVGVANELFEGQKRAVTWGRVVALYAFGAQLALHCTEKKEEEFCGRIEEFLGQYASEVLVPFVKQDGGWVRKNLCCCMSCVCFVGSIVVYVYLCCLVKCIVCR